ncbi:pyridoxamine 5'-phosphate oxidase family protein [Alkaliphilus peptidifermentans]|uniref:Pyridoxamine 5'-phosphate oxidase n=1 Tax=Alkaliphilus peptidifermentans DSM 18978 TaxID=1120976 RepID=A0A1G5L6D3_9FIRM|nr:pyridoxamine 5'-phosphate oxidase family protein [Alkaliphilus peptidifermentans]SCZ07749.1 Pyridoxamine 5'-phosphate oxidase [Alkaliphilus peptidifermentans DSM 18978]
MSTKSEFERIMATQTEIALATSVNDVCNVRIVNFIYDETSQTLFFATFGDNDKVKEFEENSNVAFTTVPHKGNEHVKARAQVNKSNLSIFDVKDSFIAKIPDYKDTINQVGQFLVLFEVKFNTAIVTLDFENIDIISLA